ncbi:MAG TPA: hypothetical protein DCR93_37335 [Cytophagales bacterium]|nr:hypothetical protein [Cytophagales bacterium]HAP64914.1 hypothetical protein [Cytophagales bacterium]
MALLGLGLASCDPETVVVPNAGTLSGGPFSFVVDGEPDMVSGITLDDSEVMGTNSSFVITDEDGNILGLPATMADLEGVDFDGAGAGVCLIWYVRYEDGLAGLAESQDIDDLTGEFDVSNSITVTRTLIGIDGGMISLEDGETTIVGVAETAQLNLTGVTTTSTATDASYWYIVTDADDNILKWITPEDRNNATIDLSGAAAGTCHIWGWSYKGLDDPVVGENISTLNDHEREEISENWITVIREDPDGGMVSLADDSELFVGVAGDIVINGIKTSSTATNLSYWYVITDADDNILTWVTPEDRNNASADLSGAPAGTCHIWGWSYKGLDDPVVGENISTLDDDDEESISSNFIEAVRLPESPEGGMVSLADDATMAVGVAGTAQLTFEGVKTSSMATQLSYWYVITDADDNILTWVTPEDRNNATLDLSGAPEGVCHIWGWSYSGLDDPVVGENISTLNDDPREAISTNWITVTRATPEGGMISLSDGTTMATGTAGTDALTFNGVTTTSTATELSYWYVITDADDNILTWVNPEDRTDATVDLSGAPTGTCHIWGWSYRGLDDPVVGENISTLDDDTEEDISANFITVVRN